MDSDSDIKLIPPNIKEAAKVTTLNLLPPTSKKLYQRSYALFMNWKKVKIGVRGKLLYSPKILSNPLQSHQAGLVIVTEKLENLQRSREYQVDIMKLNKALQWFLVNNALYEVFFNIIDLDVVIQITESPANVDADSAKQRQAVKYLAQNHVVNNKPIAIIACIVFSLFDPNAWHKSDVDYIVILGDKYYRQCIVARVNPDNRELNHKYLAVTELLP
ncbi:unnamed protein product [Psylliodes chrysocephalus]|uniref:Uncharacterized protein n=1 Tax=Psylliodes chrysocephalus TaxID=3402493 RepID=A0A9P0CTA9_9CUCU|nr:unnamed protein product [Psylliodes chrysocephala]